MDVPEIPDVRSELWLCLDYPYLVVLPVAETSIEVLSIMESGMFSYYITWYL